MGLFSLKSQIDGWLGTAGQVNLCYHSLQIRLQNHLFEMIKVSAQHQQVDWLNFSKRFGPDTYTDNQQQIRLKHT
jgi:hypothetical protein